MNNKYELIKFTDKGFELDVRTDYDKDTVWLTQEEISLLFDRNISVISRHINAIFKENELDKNTYVHFLQRSQNVPFDNHRPPVMYNLDVIISVGYRGDILPPLIEVGTSCLVSLKQQFKESIIQSEYPNTNYWKIFQKIWKTA